MSETVLVTGGSGFIGTWVVRALLQRQARVIVLDQESNPDRAGAVLVGVAAVLMLFAWLVARAFTVGRQAARLERYYSALVAQGIGLWIGVQAIINIGVNMGVLPTKGLTLPLLSFGGTGIVANMAALAILLRVDFENRQLMMGRAV